MIAPLVALLVSSSPVAPAGLAVTPTLLAKKKPKHKHKAEKKPAVEVEETSEGIDLNAPAPAPTPDPAPVSSEAESKPPELPPEPEPEPKPPSGPFSVVTPQPLGAGGNLVEGGIGWPGLHAGYWRGLLDALDAGARLSLNWGYEGQFAAQFGFKLQVTGRYRLFDNGKVSLGLNAAPGFLVYFGGVRGTRAGLTIPVGATLGLQLIPKLGLGVTFDVPFWVLFGVGAVFPLMVGAGAEYFLTDTLALWAHLGAGPSFWTVPTPVTFTLDAKVGVGWRF